MAQLGSGEPLGSLRPWPEPQGLGSADRNRALSSSSAWPHRSVWTSPHNRDFSCFLSWTTAHPSPKAPIPSSQTQLSLRPQAIHLGHATLLQ